MWGGGVGRWRGTAQPDGKHAFQMRSRSFLRKVSTLREDHSDLITLPWIVHTPSAGKRHVGVARVTSHLAQARA